MNCVYDKLSIMHQGKEVIFEDLLRQSGRKATPGRITILKILQAHGQPMTVSDITQRMKGKLNQVTIYRALEAMKESGFVRKVDLQHSHTHYELTAGIPHHHHVVCEQCGTVEDIENCNIQNLDRTALKKSKQFRSIKSHALEFFGTCDNCVKSGSN